MKNSEKILALAANYFAVHKDNECHITEDFQVFHGSGKSYAASHTREIKASEFYTLERHDVVGTSAAKAAPAPKAEGFDIDSATKKEIIAEITRLNPKFKAASKVTVDDLKEVYAGLTAAPKAPQGAEIDLTDLTEEELAALVTEKDPDFAVDGKSAGEIIEHLNGLK